eukprot:1321092-Lingulodinium_polyedra.AAC.1
MRVYGMSVHKCLGPRHGDGHAGCNGRPGQRTGKNDQENHLRTVCCKARGHNAGREPQQGSGMDT